MPPHRQSLSVLRIANHSRYSRLYGPGVVIIRTVINLIRRRIIFAIGWQIESRELQIYIQRQQAILSWLCDLRDTNTWIYWFPHRLGANYVIAYLNRYAHRFDQQ
jgi:hypothetical protein